MKEDMKTKEIMEQLNLIRLDFIEAIQIAKGTFTFKFKIPEGFTWTPGTHFHLAPTDFAQGGKPDKNKVRSFSVMSLENEGYLGFTTRFVEPISAYKKQLQTMTPSANMLMFKIGNRMELRREQRPLVFISMGVGLATFRPLIKSYENDGSDITSLISINIDSSCDFVYKDEIEAIDVDGFTNDYLGSRKELYKTIDLACNMNIGEVKPIYYVVGSDNFLGDICNYLIEKSVDARDIVIDKNIKNRSEIF